ncbi:hypothetical protein LY90DRAFT_210256 [Neocallimastix californiae]|jgi:hypothetical protein|uniref:Uncharacterized protein n=1 Tax=Neocallimastix californiae TaxID=1754190 RepID=A0A1Y1Z767_9FUNG|nr:hypothetical protein LY90DRAFT_210256 [Neocallimastix californiae]|eukprot:ORY06056.1 hypothetical protein LY90DRAFT_210256 [Neocallimastix californiae]
MSGDKQPRISSFGFSKEIFNDPSFSSFLFDNNDVMNFGIDKKTETNKIKSENSRRSPSINSPSMTSPKLTSHSPNMGSPKAKLYQQQSYGKYDSNYTNTMSSQKSYDSIYSNTMSSQKSYNKYGSSSSSYHLNSPISAPVENYSASYKQSNVGVSNESSESNSYYSIINAIKRENINNINMSSKSLNNANSNISSPSSPPLTPPSMNMNVNNQKFYKGATQQSYSAVDLSRPDQYYDEIKGSKSVKDYSMSGPHHVKQRSKSIHTINSGINQNVMSSTYDDDALDYLNDSMTEYSFTQKESYEPSVTTNGSEKEKKGHSRSLSKSLKRAVSRSSKKNKKGHHKNSSTSEKSSKAYDNVSYSGSGKQSEMGQFQELNDSALVFKPSSGAISSYGELSNNDSNFDFDSMISSDQTRKISLTPNRMNEIQKNNGSASRLKPKNYEREKFVPMTVINGTITRNKGGNGYNNINSNMNTNMNGKMNMNMSAMDDYDSDDSIDRLLNEGKPKKKQETLWEFLKNSDPEDFMGGNGKSKQTNKKVQPQTNSNSQGSQVKYIPIKIQYSPFDQKENNNNNNSNSNDGNVGSNNNNNTLNKQRMVNGQPNSAMNNTRSPMNENVMKISPNLMNGGLPLQQRSGVAVNKNMKVPAPPPHGNLPVPPAHGVPKSTQMLSPINTTGTSQAMKLAQTISLLAKTPELSSADEEYTPQTPTQPPFPQTQAQTQTQEQKPRMVEKPKPKMVSTGTQYYISDAPLMRKKKVLFRPVDRRNPIAKYMFNHAFVETIYVTNGTFRRRRNVPESIPIDFLARNFYYYARNPSAVPPMPKRPVLDWTYPERDSNPIAKYMYLVKEGDYPWRDTNPVAKYMFNGWEKKDVSSVIINSEYLFDSVVYDVADKEIEIINDVLSETSCGSEDSTEITKVEADSEINDEAISSLQSIKKNEIDKELQGFYTQKEKEEIINKLFGKIINYLEDKEKTEKEKEKENNKTQEFAKLMFDENTKLHKELTKLRSELSAERVLRERAVEELERYQNLMQSTFLN